MSQIYLPAHVRQDIAKRKVRRIQAQRVRSASSPSSNPYSSGGWDGADAFDDISAFTRLSVPINAEIQSALRVLRARSRWLAKNDGYVRRFLQLSRNNVVGHSGFRFRSLVASKRGKPQKMVQAAIQDAWREFSKLGVCCALNALSMHQIENLILDTWLRDGEVLILRYLGPDEGRFGCSFRIIDPELLPVEYNDKFSNGNEVRMGIEVDDRGRRVAYHFRGLSAMGDTYYGRAGKQYIRVLAENVRHFFQVEYADQLRGVPHIAAAMLRSRRIGGYEDAEVIAKRVSSAKMGFVTPGENNEVLDGEAGLVIENDGEEVLEVYEDDEHIEIEPATIARLSKGASFTPFDIQHHGDFDSFMKRMLRGLASGMGVSYHSLASDLEGVNYASMRGGVQEDRENWMELQRQVIDGVLDYIFDTFLEMGTLSQAIVQANGKPLSPTMLDKNRAHTFTGRRWDWVDPDKDMSSNQKKLGMCVTSVSKLMRDSGLDPEEVWTELSEDKKRLEELGLSINLKPGAGEKPKKPDEEGGNVEETDNEDTDNDEENDDE